jgi:hypothetical protein
VKRERKLIAEKGHSFSGYAGAVYARAYPDDMPVPNADGPI